ncbi:MAG: phosphoribosylglycinamide formyltransferase [Actinomycetota bacterium]|nr:phosphoribosylglycinamide formyltransferase [Actinomycetota bacterium]
MLVGVLASGGGSILEAVLGAGVPAEVVLVDRPCPATDVAAAHGVPAVLVARESFGPSFDRVAYTERLVDELQAREVELVVMAGFMTVLEKPIFDAYGGRVLNTHPALLPSFRGAHAVRQAIEAGVKVTGCTVHVATLEVDEGPILAQEAVAVRPDDTEATLHERIKVVERRLLPATVHAIIERGTVLP